MSLSETVPNDAPDPSKENKSKVNLLDFSYLTPASQKWAETQGKLLCEMMDSMGGISFSEVLRIQMAKQPIPYITRKKTAQLRRKLNRQSSDTSMQDNVTGNLQTQHKGENFKRAKSKKLSSSTNGLEDESKEDLDMYSPKSFSTSGSHETYSLPDKVLTEGNPITYDEDEREIPEEDHTLTQIRELNKLNSKGELMDDEDDDGEEEDGLNEGFDEDGEIVIALPRFEQGHGVEVEIMDMEDNLNLNATTGTTAAQLKNSFVTSGRLASLNLSKIGIVSVAKNLATVQHIQRALENSAPRGVNSFQSPNQNNTNKNPSITHPHTNPSLPNRPAPHLPLGSYVSNTISDPIRARTTNNISNTTLNNSNRNTSSIKQDVDSEKERLALKKLNPFPRLPPTNNSLNTSPNPSPSPSPSPLVNPVSSVTPSIPSASLTPSTSSTKSSGPTPLSGPSSPNKNITIPSKSTSNPISTESNSPSIENANKSIANKSSEAPKGKSGPGPVSAGSSISPFPPLPTSSTSTSKPISRFGPTIVPSNPSKFGPTSGPVSSSSNTASLNKFGPTVTRGPASFGPQINLNAKAPSTVSSSASTRSSNRSTGSSEADREQLDRERRLLKKVDVAERPKPKAQIPHTFTIDTDKWKKVEDVIN